MSHIMDCFTSFVVYPRVKVGLLMIPPVQTHDFASTNSVLNIHKHNITICHAIEIE